jgi:outer membrane immunogenic protein
MKRMLIGISAFVSLIATGAIAADLPVKTYTKAPVYVDPGFDWTGFYIGGNIGYSWGQSRDTSTITNGAGTVLFTSTDKTSLDGIVGGGQIGYNWQMQRGVFGLEADIQGTDEKGSRSFTCGIGVCTPPLGNFNALVLPGPAVPVTLNQKIDWFGTVRGRIGYLVDPRVLIYATGGLAYGEVGSSATIGVVPTAFGTVTNTHVGWTAGFGIEGAIGGNWTARLEYLYVDLGTVNGSFLTTIGGLGGGALSSNYSSRVTDNVLRVGVNYKFGGPVVAKY